MYRSNHAVLLLIVCCGVCGCAESDVPSTAPTMPESSALAPSGSPPEPENDEGLLEVIISEPVKKIVKRAIEKFKNEMDTDLDQYKTQFDNEIADIGKDIREIQTFVAESDRKIEQAKENLSEIDKSMHEFRSIVTASDQKIQKTIEDLANVTARSEQVKLEMVKSEAEARTLKTQIELWKLKEKTLYSYLGLILWVIGLLTLLKYLMRPVLRMLTAFLLKNYPPTPRQVVQ